MSGIPQAAITAGVMAVRKLYPGIPPEAEVRRDVRAILEAAGQFLAAVERERCAQLADQLPGNALFTPGQLAALLREAP
jgi:hypothetical protein